MSQKQSRHILIVDDNDHNLYMLQTLLSNYGYSTMLAGDGEQALQLAREQTPDLVISDILMPVMDGFALCQEWRLDPVLKSQPFIFYTATYTDDKDKKLAFKIGANHFIIKPQEPRVLIEIINEVLRQHTHGELTEASIESREEPVIMREYNQALVRKLEDKMLQVEASEIRFRDFAEIAANWFIETDKNLVVNYVSQHTSANINLPTQSLIDTRLIDLLYANNTTTDYEWLVEKLNNREPITDFENSLSKDSNNKLILRYSGKAYFDKKHNFSGYRFVALDISESRKLSTQLSYQASHDTLTGLINRPEFNRRLRRLITDKQDPAEHVLCYLDLDQFKIINDTCGHIAGDSLLKQLATSLTRSIRDRDSLARVGGDEFAVLMEHCSISQAQRVAENIRETINNFLFKFEDKSFEVSASIGLVVIDQNNREISSIMSAADAACYAAKDQGGDRVHMYQYDDANMARWYGDMEWTNIINLALKENRFTLYTQSIEAIQKSDTEPSRYEVLIRMVSPTGELVMPGNFLPAAEKYNLIQKIDRWVVDTAFDWLLQNSSQLPGETIFSINLSGNSLGDEELLEHIVEQFSERVDPRQICFEITETSAVANFLEANDFINRLRELGCQFSIDDFGSGVCSFAYLKAFEFDYIKIDGMFVHKINEDAISHAVVKSISEIGHVMGKKIVAEYVENEPIQCTLVDIGVDYLQGYSIDYPQPIDKLLK